MPTPWEAALTHPGVDQDSDAKRPTIYSGYKGLQRRSAGGRGVRLACAGVTSSCTRQHRTSANGRSALELKANASRSRSRNTAGLRTARRGCDALQCSAPGAGRKRGAPSRQDLIDAVVPDDHARFPKPCVGGWGRLAQRHAVGKVLPCHPQRRSGPGVLERARAFARRIWRTRGLNELRGMIY